MTPNTATPAARTIVQTLLGAGIQHVILCPGSRSAPLAYAFHAAAEAGHITLSIRVDERVAGFTALGVGKATGIPAVVVTTSGTAVANLHPSVLEARHSHTPLLVLSADRPENVRDSWANQTTPFQHNLFGDVVLANLDVDAATVSTEDLSTSTCELVNNAIAHSAGPGPVHLNVGFTEPLTPPDPWYPRAPEQPAKHPSSTPQSDSTINLTPGTVVLAGDGATLAATEYAEQWHLPLFAEPTSGARVGPHAVTGYRMLAEHAAFGGHIEQVIVFGRPTLSRSITALLDRADTTVVAPAHHRGPATNHHRTSSAPKPHRPSTDAWLLHWQNASAKADEAIKTTTEEWPRLTGVGVAQELAKVTYEDRYLVAAASNSIRDLDLCSTAVGRRHQTIYANRGLAGIDGTLATAMGIATAHNELTRCLIGDLAFVHDCGALALPTGLTPPHLQIVVNNDSGGGIFSLLEYPHSSSPATFEQLFGTGTNTQFRELCATWNVPYTRVDTAEALSGILMDPAPGLSVIETVTHRTDLAAFHARLAANVHAALGH